MTSDRLGRTSIDRVIKAAPAEVADLLRRFTREPLQEGSVLLGRVRAYLEELQHLSEESEFLDLVLARRVADQCESLIASLPTSGSEDAHRLVQAAVRYFVEAGDAEADLSSPIGFDDDAQVVELVARELGWEHILSPRKP